MKQVTVKLNRAAVRQLLREDMAADLADRGRRIARAAGEGYAADTTVGRNRARVTVRTATAAARRDSARRGTLVRSLDAGR